MGRPLKRHNPLLHPSGTLQGILDTIAPEMYFRGGKCAAWATICNASYFANLAILLNRKVRRDMNQQQFSGDAEADMLIRRRQRAPYTIEI